MFNRSRVREARQLLERAVSADPNYGVAHASLSRAYGMMLDFDMEPAEVLQPLAVQAAQRALTVSPDLAEANLAFADTRFRFEHDWDAADAAYTRALGIAPQASIILSPYARFLCAEGRLDEALVQARAGEQADPLSAEMVASVGVTHYYRREYDQALAKYERAAQLSPSYGPVFLGMAKIYSARGEYQKAVELIGKATSLVGDNAAYRAELARNYAAAGWRNLAEQALGGLLASARDAKTPVSYEGIGYTYAALGEKDRAFEWLNRAMEHYFARMLFLKVDPRADPLRDDPRYGVLLQRLGLQP